MKTPINNGLAQSDIDFNNRKPANADLSDYAGDNLTWNNSTKKFDATVTPPSESVMQNIFFPETYGAVGDGTTDDTTALQDCIDAAVATAGTVKLSPVTYKITTALSVTGSVAIEGSGMFPQNGTVDTSPPLQSMNMPYVSPYIKGSVLLQTGAGENGITINVTGLGVNLRDFGIRFADAIKFTDTGHGIFAEGADYAGFKNNGIMSSLWSNLGVYGHDGDHYAYHLTNPICSTFNHLTGWGGGGIRIESNNNWSYYGNAVFEHPYFALCVAGTAHGYHMKLAPGANYLMLLTFIRPQVNVADTGVATPPTNMQNTFRIDQAIYVNILGPDFETDCGSITVGVYGASKVNVTAGIADGNFEQWGDTGAAQKINGDLTVSNGVITGSGSIPAGGTTGQVLTKLSNSNYDVGWV